MSKFQFKIIKKDSKTKARVGEITTSHGKISTPVFMPIGTQAAVKTMSPRELEEIGAEIILGNAYHLYLRPGEKVIKHFGGLHKFMNWGGPILTDSGGFQVFSLGKGSRNNHEQLIKITNQGVEFSSHIDGSKHFFTPEKAIRIQEDLGADIMMAFDECAPSNSSYNYAKEAMKRTHLWAKKCQKVKKRTNQALFGIIQGTVFSDLRIKSAQFISNLNFDGIAIGGLAVGERRTKRNKVLDLVEPYIPYEKPRYVMGIGEPIDLFNAIEKGMDMFDCVIPTRMARHGTSWTRQGRINLKLAKYKKDKNPIEKGCLCYVCKNFSKGYIRHLLISEEILGIRLTTHHNLFFILDLMRNIRNSIKENKFLEFKKNF